MAQSLLAVWVKALLVVMRAVKMYAKMQVVDGLLCF